MADHEDRTAPPAAARRPQLVGALVLMLVAVVTTVTCVAWIWNRADAASPVDLPAADGSPLRTVKPSVRPTPTPPPTGRVVGQNMVASNNDRMPLLSSAWSDGTETTRLYGGAATWLTVRENYDGKGADWGNYVAFGGLNKTIPFKNTPAGLRQATIQAGSAAIGSLYDQDVELIGKASHRRLTVQGRRAHELTVKVAIKVPRLKETFSTVAVVVIDRGDGSAVVSVADFAGSTPQWLAVWRAKVQQIRVGS